MELLAVPFEMVLPLIESLLEPNELLTLEIDLIIVTKTEIEILVLDALLGTFDDFGLHEDVNIAQLVVLHLSKLTQSILVGLNQKIP